VGDCGGFSDLPRLPERLTAEFEIVNLSEKLTTQRAITTLRCPECSTEGAFPISLIKVILVAVGVLIGVALAVLAVEVAEAGSVSQLLLAGSAAIVLGAVAVGTGWSLFKR
jgi:hypothetical protein